MPTRYPGNPGPMGRQNREPEPEWGVIVFIIVVLIIASLVY